MIARLIATVTTLTCCFALLKAVEPGDLVGVLEEVPGHLAGEPNVRAVRVVFQKTATEWQPFPSECGDPSCLRTITAQYPAEVTWTIIFDGRNWGRVIAHTPPDFKYLSDQGLQTITSGGTVPTVGRKSKDYSGWLDSPVYRPLIAVSQPHFRDPELWKPTRFSSKMTGALRQQFREKFPEVENCKNPDENILRPWKYPDTDIKLVKTYSSKNHWSLAEMILSGYRCDFIPEAPFLDQWYVIDPEGKIVFLGQEMWLVDAGDYDDDGKSEVVFSIAGYDRGGYLLFYDDFGKHATFEYVYH